MKLKKIKELISHYESGLITESEFEGLVDIKVLFDIINTIEKEGTIFYLCSYGQIDPISNVLLKIENNSNTFTLHKINETDLYVKGYLSAIEELKKIAQIEIDKGKEIQKESIRQYGYERIEGYTPKGKEILELADKLHLLLCERS